MPVVRAFESEAEQRLPALLAQLLGANEGSVVARGEHIGNYSPELAVQAGGLTFDIQVSQSSSVATLSMAAGRLSAYRAATKRRGEIPLIVVPYMGDTGKAFCAEMKQNWLDLSGNADIQAPGVRILVQGKPNHYKRKGRPSTAFAPKGARIARWLLMHPERTFTQKELAEATASDKGYTSKMMGKLVADGFVTLYGSNYRVADPKLLFSAWREAYDFSKHTLIRGSIAARDGESAVRSMVNVLEKRSIDYAATGLAGAWFIDHFALFRIATLYLKTMPSEALLSELRLTERDKGANVWLVVPNDEGVLHGKSEYDGITCVHPVQVYLDLLAHPERAKEAAVHLQQEHLGKLGLVGGLRE